MALLEWSRSLVCISRDVSKIFFGRRPKSDLRLDNHTSRSSESQTQKHLIWYTITLSWGLTSPQGLLVRVVRRCGVRGDEVGTLLPSETEMLFDSSGDGGERGDPVRKKFPPWEKWVKIGDTGRP